MASFAGFILIGGKSSRMGEDKFSLVLNGKTFLEIAFETLQNFGDVAFVVSEDKGKGKRDKGQKIVKDIYPNRGALSGIHSALINSTSDFSIILACDYPFVSAELIQFLTDLVQTEKDFDAFAPIQKDGKIQPLCAVYKTEICRKVLTEMLQNEGEKYSARDFLKRIKSHYIDFAEIENLPNADYFFLNVNTPEDFILAEKIQESLKEKTTVEIVQISLGDIDIILRIQQESSLSYWSFEDYKNEIGREDSYSVAAKINGQLVGFLVARLIEIENCAELYNIGVDLGFRRRKVGEKLLEGLLKFCVENNLEKIFLEVRESNETAIQFYLKNKFTIIGKRKKFYTNPAEDAVLMICELLR